MVAVALFLLCPGCTGIRQDISNDKSYATDYTINQVYRLKKSVFVEGISNEMLLKKPGRMQSGPASAEEYEASDMKKWPNVIGFLKTGTRMKIRKIELKKSFEIGNVVWVKGEILEGKFAGKLAELYFISKEFSQRTPLASIPKVDPDYLELIPD